MTTDHKVTEIFCAIDEFCKKFDAEIENQPLLTNECKAKRPQQKVPWAILSLLRVLKNIILPGRNCWCCQFFGGWRYSFSRLGMSLYC